MTTLKVKFKRLVKHAFIPEYSKPGDAGMDLVAIDSYKNHDYKFIEYGTGIAVEIPEGYVGLVYPRSSISKTPHTLANSVGVIDSGYRGEIKLRMRYVDEREDMEYGFGDRVGQLIIVPYPKVELEEVEELSTTDRGEEGFGSTGS
jgi:dUTP pyrophosphatase